MPSSQLWPGHVECCETCIVREFLRERSARKDRQWIDVVAGSKTRSSHFGHVTVARTGTTRTLWTCNSFASRRLKDIRGMSAVLRRGLTRLPSLLDVARTVSHKNVLATRSIGSKVPAYEGHIPLNWFETGVLAVGSAFMSLADPRRGGEFLC